MSKICYEWSAQEEAVQFLSVHSAYTSQTCPICQVKHPQNRKLDRFKCLNCGYTNHADVVGAINIAKQASIVPAAERSSLS